MFIKYKLFSNIIPNYLYKINVLKYLDGETFSTNVYIFYICEIIKYYFPI